MSRRTIGIAAAISTMLWGPVAAQAPSTHLYGTPPEWEAYRALAEAEVRSRLKDPQSAQFTWLGGYYKGDYKVVLGPRFHGYVACGEVNAKNAMGGYVGATSFVTVIDYDRVLRLEMDNDPGSFATNQCAQMKRQGLLPALPAAAGEPGSSSVGATKASVVTGLTVMVMPEGGYASSVAPGSLAATAGIKPGMVITSVNAIPLAGMGSAMLTVIEAAGAKAALTIVGGTTFKLGAKP